MARCSRSTWILLIPYVAALLRSALAAGGLQTAHERGERIDTVSIDPSDSRTSCNVTGLCLPCSPGHKKTDPSCRPTGYRQAISCIEQPTEAGGDVFGAGEKSTKAKATDTDTATASDEAAVNNRRGVIEEEHVTSGLTGGGKGVAAVPGQGMGVDGKEVGGGGGGEGDKRRLLASSLTPQVRRFETFQSCFPANKETLSVLGFEGIVFSILSVCAPIVYHRRKRAQSNAPVTRIPSSTRL